LEPPKAASQVLKRRLVISKGFILCTNNTVTKNITFSKKKFIGEMIDKSQLSKIKQLPQKVHSKLNSNSKYPQNKSSTMIGICN
jgi:hypothetical protein